MSLPDQQQQRGQPGKPSAEATSHHQPTGSAAGIGAALVVIVAILGTTMLNPLYPLIERDQHLSSIDITIIFAVYAVGVVTTLLVFGELSNQSGRKPVLAAGLVFSVLSAGVLLIGDGVPELVIARALSGVSGGLFVGAGTAYILDLTPAGKQKQGALIAAIASIGGIGLGPFLAGLFSQYLPGPLRSPFVADIILVVVVSGLLVVLPETIRRHGKVRIVVTRPGVPRSARSDFVRASFAGFGGFVVIGLFSAVVPSALTDIFGIDDRFVLGLVTALLFGASLVGQLAMQFVGEARGLPVGAVVLAAGVVVLGFGFGFRSFALFIVAGIVAGIGQGLAFRSGLSLITADSPVAERASVVSAFYSILYSGLAVPVIIVGVLVAVFDLRVTAIGACACIAVLALVASKPRKSAPAS